MMKRVRCLDNLGVANQITIGREYLVVKETPPLQFYIANDDNTVAMYLSYRFQVVESVEVVVSHQSKSYTDQCPCGIHFSRCEYHA